MKKWFKILLIGLLFSASTLKAQVELIVNHPKGLLLSSADLNYSFLRYTPSVFTVGEKSKNPFKSFAFQNVSPTSFPKIYSVNDLAFFCKVEVKLEKAAKFPVKFRLGDVNYVDQLEGK